MIFKIEKKILKNKVIKREFSLINFKILIKYLEEILKKNFMFFITNFLFFTVICIEMNFFNDFLSIKNF